MLKYIYAICLSLLLFSSCGERGKSELPNTQTGTNLSVEAIKNNIAALNTADWSAEEYDAIQSQQIDKATELSSQDKEALSKALCEAYADQIVRCADKIMSGSCEASHQALNGMVADIGKVSSKLQDQSRKQKLQGIKQRYEKHDTMLAFAVDKKYDKDVTATSSYDSSYDSKVKSEAAGYRAQNPTCTAIKRNISESEVDAALAKRRADFNAQLEKAKASQQKKSSAANSSKSAASKSQSASAPAANDGYAEASAAPSQPKSGSNKKGNAIQNAGFKLNQIINEANASQY